MLLNKALQLAMLAAAVLLKSRTEAATSPVVKFCGRQLSEIMSRVCHAYNSPWDTPTVVEQPGSVVRRRRQVENGIADECCNNGCTWGQLSEYCSISTNSESPLEDTEAHIIADRSAEQGVSVTRVVSTVTATPASVGSAGLAGRAAGARGRTRSRGYGRARARGRRCWCRRKRRSGRRRSSLMGNMDLDLDPKRNVARAAPVVGTVSPLITWGRTLNTDFSTASRDQYAYVVYAQ
ncbi:uncharacterized protein LOC111358449 isoform X1 [Spodoptera litura]|uniref:Uncharacterized protein LOC111358449 isoform X1 n=1 Tax=Spodoptera litura TaxID=69820 RepID=A0A9J7EF78_SPOLT|nr:uncharacterized protein LOC111358449 isoform X1 [Spodoptera litura]XP_022829358.1 uncharacterized protein LOC111358449 isoform X1 [Spodoptera litura]